MATYAEKLRHPQWQKKRLEILSRDGFTCTSCGAKDSTLHVHHARYIRGREPWEYPPELLTTLCEPCHEKLEKDKDFVIEILSRGENYSMMADVLRIAQSIEPRTELPVLMLEKIVSSFCEFASKVPFLCPGCQSAVIPPSQTNHPSSKVGKTGWNRMYRCAKCGGIVGTIELVMAFMDAEKEK